MFTFGSSPVLGLDNARLFAQQFQLEEDRPTLRRIARASALCHQDLVQCLALNVTHNQFRFSFCLVFAVQKVSQITLD